MRFMAVLGDLMGVSEAFQSIPVGIRKFHRLSGDFRGPLSV